jgi:hypothetical protein
MRSLSFSCLRLLLVVVLEALLQDHQLLARVRLHARRTQRHTRQTILEPAHSLATVLLLVFHFGELVVPLHQLRHEPVALVLAVLKLALQVVELIRLLRNKCRARVVELNEPMVTLKLARLLELSSELLDLRIAIGKMTFEFRFRELQPVDQRVWRARRGDCCSASCVDAGCGGCLVGGWSCRGVAISNCRKVQFMCKAQTQAGALPLHEAEMT